MAASCSLTAYRALFTALGCLMLATLIYTMVTDGSPFRAELLTPWLSATLIDFYTNVFAISVWVAYRESSWVSAILWIVLLVCFGSVSTCAYIVMQLVSISSQGHVEDPVSLVLLRNVSQRKMKFCPLLVWRVVFSVLAVLMAGVVIYTVATDGLPFRKELLTPWMAATLIDFYINIVAISVWVTHKEKSWTSAIIWILLLICFGSITTCTYIAIQLFHLSIGDPMYEVLLDRHSKPATSPNFVSKRKEK